MYGDRRYAHRSYAANTHICSTGRSRRTATADAPATELTTSAAGHSPDSGGSGRRTADTSGATPHTSDGASTSAQANGTGTGNASADADGARNRRRRGSAAQGPSGGGAPAQQHGSTTNMLAALRGTSVAGKSIEAAGLRGLQVRPCAAAAPCTLPQRRHAQSSDSHRARAC